MAKNGKLFVFIEALKLCMSTHCNVLMFTVHQLSSTLLKSIPIAFNSVLQSYLFTAATCSFVLTLSGNEGVKK